MEPDLLANLFKSLKAGNDQAMGLPTQQREEGPASALAAAAGGEGGEGGRGAGVEAAAEMAEAAAKCVAALMTVGALGVILYDLMGAI